VESLGDGLREGGEALAKGLFRGVPGVVMKPIEGAQERGVGVRHGPPAGHRGRGGAAREPGPGLCVQGG